MKFAVQYLEGGHDWSQVTAEAARLRLRQAGERLPINFVLVGWDIPKRLVEACAEEAARLRARFYRWQPLLTGDGTLQPRPAWQVVNCTGEKVAGFSGMPEFTFMCPNRPAVQEALSKHVLALAQVGMYQGLFLDRVRFPSPTVDPFRHLACFCPDCRRRAEAEGFDLEVASKALRNLTATSEGALRLVGRLLTVHPVPTDDPRLAAIDKLLDFRQASITQFVASMAELAQSNGLEVGLDCFSPCLTRMVGQDLGALDACSDWIKVMAYGRTFGPAGLPFELLGLADWLAGRYGLEERTILNGMAQAVGFDLPPNRSMLRKSGLDSAALATEIHRGRSMGVDNLWGGIALVELTDVNEMTAEQARSDAAAFRRGEADGLVISWDLWHIPLERLDWLKMTAG